MKLRISISRVGLFVLLCIVLFGCRIFYKHKSDDQNREQKVKKAVSKQWKSMEVVHHMVIHVGQEMKEIYDIIYNEETDSIYANIKPFEGEPLESYLKVTKKRIQHATRRHSASVPDIRQIHLYLKGYENQIDNTKIAFSVQDIYQVDFTKQASFLNSLANTGLITAGVAVGVVALYIVACNCPHVYIDTGDELVYNNTLFTGAKAPQLERYDFKELPDYFPDSDQLSLKIVNEDEEDQFTNLLELITVIHDKDIEVIPDKNGKIYTVQNLNSPTSVVDNNNNSLLSSIEYRDDNPYLFNPDSFEDLAEVSMTFNAVNQTNDAKLVIRARNTMWSGYVYNEFNKLFGNNYSKWVEMNKDKSKEERENWMRDQGIKILVDIKEDGKWRNIDEVELFGEATMNQVVIPIQRKLFGEQLEVRLRSGFMFWELDYVGVDFTENKSKSVIIQSHKPTKAIGNNGQDFTHQLSYNDQEYMEHEMAKENNTTDVLFDKLPIDSTKNRTFILKSKGYYVPKSDYTGKTDRKRLKAFLTPGELSRFSHQLYEDVMQQMVSK